MSPSQRAPAIGDRAFLLDGAVIGLVSLAICLFSQELLVMTLLVPVIYVVRLVLWKRFVSKDQGGFAAELGFLLLCTVLAGFNDWNSVVRHQIYDYTVPHFFPEITTIPIWMLLFWGLILRFMADLVSYERFGARGHAREVVRFGGRRIAIPWLVIVIELVLLLTTRQAIYRLYLDPVFSWLPFLVALIVHFALLGWDRHDLKLCGMAFLGGWAIEVLYIQVGALHRYHLDWFGGVPLWIILWWMLAVMIWKDLELRIRGFLAIVPTHGSGSLDSVKHSR